MRRTLNLHPQSYCPAVAQIEVEVARTDRLALRFLVTGRISDLRLPPLTDPARTDELWQHTCFEAFIRPLPGDAYCEFNFSPSTQWAAYQFDGYRSGMRAADEFAPPRTEIWSDATSLELSVALELSDAAWQMGLSAVIEETNGRKSYWALAHPLGRVNFHHADCFALELPAASQP
jgi:hypothetical protein